MFESAELGHKISKERFAEEAPKVREALLDAQYELAKNPRFPVLILIGGVDGAGKGEVMNLLHAWMDPRYIHTFALDAASEEEVERPPMFRFWRALPPKGRIGIFMGSWYTTPIVQRVYGETKDGDLSRSVEQILHFEQMLVNEGALILKLWFHLGKKTQKARLSELEKNPKTRWRVSDLDWKHFELYDKFRKVSERVLRETSTGAAPWTVIDGSDHRYRALTAAEALLDALRKRLDAGAHAENTVSIQAPPLVQPLDGLNVLGSLDLTKTLEERAYEDEMEDAERRLSLASRDPRFRKTSIVAVFEGSDAAGKGGAIRRITGALDARLYRVVPIAAPTEEERAQPYMWRFWRHIPRRGRIAIFDRSWYGRVLVERVERFCSESAYMRAYGEINDFEDQLVDHGIIVLKFWLQVSKEEQLRRFKEREETGFKRFKITQEDWRNREKWDDYERAVCDMIDRTSTDQAPWTLVEANDKKYARVKILRTVADRIEAQLGRKKKG
ncbi:MAG: polyphosphate:AMP phosphotransferase [Polyangiaceae bacterium]